jgi:ribose 5-phosphate isomerase B
VSEKDSVHRVAVGADPACQGQKATIMSYLEALGYRVVEASGPGGDLAGFAQSAVEVCKKVASGACDRGIAIDGSGIGSCVAGNKIKGIRAALCYDLRTVMDSREHLDANVLALGGKMHGIDDLCRMAKAWLETRFDAGRHSIGVNRIRELERGGLRD